MQGILLIDKPAGWTSFDVVNYVRQMIATAEDKKPRSVKVGHTGTLDPFATGLLVLLIDKDYTRRAAEFSQLDKIYEVTMRLGETSITGDPEGEITSVSHNKPTEMELKTTLKEFVGKIEQIPPAYSAIKINGQRAYKLARSGKTVKLEPRKVTINNLKLITYAYPEIKFIADVSSGTYIRTLVADLGHALGTGAYTTALRRTLVGHFNIKQSTNVKILSIDNINIIV